MKTGSIETKWGRGRLGRASLTYIRGWGTKDRVIKDRRGAMSLLFAASAVGLLGMAGLATETGTWYLAKRLAQNAADGGAISGALSIANGITATDAVKATALANANANMNNAGVTIATGSTNHCGTSGKVTICVFRPPTWGTQTANNGAVGVTVSEAFTPAIAALFGSSAVTVTTRAVAVASLLTNPCALALGQLTIGGNFSSTSGGCGVGTNDTASNALTMNGNSSSVAGTVVSSGGCSGTSCSNSNVFTAQPVATNPFAALTDPGLTFNGGSCDNTDPPTPWVAGTHAKARCSNWTVASGTVLTLTSGTYFFYNSTISIKGTVTCSGCSFVLIGSPANQVSALSVTGGGTLNISAPAYGGGATTYTAIGSAWDGLAIYRPSGSTAPGGNAAIDIGGNGNTAGSLTLGGVIYAPNSDFNLRANASISAIGSCSEIIALQVTLSGSSTMALTGCRSQDTTSYDYAKLSS
jgi:Flp pilus assembly protein TadG